MIEEIGTPKEVFEQLIDFLPAITVRPVYEGAIRRSYVLSERSLMYINYDAKVWGVSRDSMVEAAIRRLVGIVRQERAISKERRAQAREAISSAQQRVRELLPKMDPLRVMMDTLVLPKEE